MKHPENNHLIKAAEANPGNPFLALARALWTGGLDGEDIARTLKNALYAIINEGLAPSHKELTEDAIINEIKRL